VEYFVFSTIIRLISIDKIRTRSSRASGGTDNCIIKSSTDYKKCFELFKQSSIKNTNFSTDMFVKYFEIKKKDSSSKRILGINNIIDRIIQLQFVTLLDPLIDSQLPTRFYGFRKSRSALQAIAYLSHSIQVSDLTRYHLLKIDIEKCFDNLDHEYILNNFPFPNKHKKLLIR
jgi:retron-type reverse transcriptase